MIKKEIELDIEIDQYEDDWDHDDIDGRCSPCRVMVNGFGVPQCVDCLCVLNLRRDKKLIISWLKELHGPVWEEEWARLKETHSLVRCGVIEGLKMICCTYRDKDGKIKTERCFYEKVRSD